MKTPPVLYQPTEAEINQVVESGKRRHLDMTDRLDRAGQILLTGALQLDDLAWSMRQMARWRVESQSGRGAYVIVGLACPCEDRRAPIVDGHRFCKHTCAVSLYMKVLRNHVNADIRRFDVELGILPDKTFSAFAKGMGATFLKKDGGTYDFVRHDSAVSYSIWLAKRKYTNLPAFVSPSAVAVVA